MMKNDSSIPSINLNSLNLSQGSIMMDTPDQTPLIKVKETIITPENQDMQIEEEDYAPQFDQSL